MSGKTAQKSGNQGCIIFAAIIGVLIFISSLGNCSGSSPVTSEQPFGAQSLQDQVESIAATASVQPLNDPAIALGVAHFKAANDAEGLPGAMVYSQNCYDHVSREFSWASLDTCGAFDVRAAKNATGQTGLGANEARYFTNDATAARYIAVATRAGEEVKAAGDRAHRLQAQSAAVGAR